MADGESVAGPVRAAGYRRLVGSAASGRPRGVDRAAVITATLTPPPAKLGVTTGPPACWEGVAGSALHGRGGLGQYGVKLRDVPVLRDHPAGRQRSADVVGPSGSPRTPSSYVSDRNPRSGVGPDQAAAGARLAIPAAPAWLAAGTAPRPSSPRWRVATGKSDQVDQNRHRRKEERVGLKHVARRPTPTSSYLVMDNTPPTRRQRSAGWLATPRIHVHFTPTSGSWLNLVEVWFGIIGYQTTPPRHLLLRRRTQPDPRLHHRLERPVTPLPPGQPADNPSHPSTETCITATDH